MITFVLSYLTFDMMYIQVPAIAVFGISFVLFFLIVGLFERLYPKCTNCKGYGAINLNLRQKIANALFVGAVGEKCKKCNSSGIVNISKLYKKQLQEGKNKDV